MNRLIAAMAVILSALAAVGCASSNHEAPGNHETPGSAGARGNQEARGAESPAPATKTASASPSASPTPGPRLSKQPMTAADGADTDACHDGSCEVRVSDGDQFSFKAGNGLVARAHINSVSEDGFNVVITSDFGVVGGDSGPRQAQFLGLNSVHVIAVAARKGVGVLRLERDK
ncbi:MAG: hypothetical protein ACRDT8_25765 [Micromonosporaceae bacterium]